jgi:glyoxylase-like metal-dependent hydrolase (beta-lactamase superfamily II)
MINDTDEPLLIDAGWTSETKGCRVREAANEHGVDVVLVATMQHLVHFHQIHELGKS